MAQEIPSRAQDLLWRLEAFAFDLVAGAFRVLPLDLASDTGAWLFGVLGPLTSADRTVRRNLSIAFPDASEAEIARLRKAQWRNLGRFFVEFPMTDRIIADPSRVEVVGRERLTQVAGSDKPVVLISGHLSNFEIMAAAIIQAGVRCRVAYRAANNPHFDERIRRSRARYGVKLLAKGAEGAREMMRALQRGESVAMLVDQRLNEGVAQPIFGVTAHTAPGPVAFALRYGLAMLPMSVQRLKKARFRVVVHEPIVLETTGDKAHDIEEGVRRMNAFIEARIREHPTEWFWVHKRWPKELYRKDDAPPKGELSHPAALQRGDAKVDGSQSDPEGD
jgi:KDO2-lipid IV(A) lauroyltransferase